MIRSFLVGMLCFIIGSSQAQIRVGVQAGYNAVKWKYTVTPENWVTTTDAISSFSAGMLARLDLKNNFNLQGSLLFSGIGTKLKQEYRFESSSRDIMLYNLHLPVVIMYRANVKKMGFGLGGGFYGAYMLFGTEKGAAERFVINGPPLIKPVDNKIEFASVTQPFDPNSTDPINVKRFDGGYVALGNVEFDQQFIVQVTYTSGLNEILPGGYYYSGNFKNRVISLSLAVLFKRNR